MMTADRWSDITQPCICRWTARDGGGWTLAAQADNCPSPAHEQETRS